MLDLLINMMYIGRGCAPHPNKLSSNLGNPFIIGLDGDRGEVIQKHLQYLEQNPHLFEEILKLKGLRLGCWCAPKACHGDILAEIANYFKTN
jgi:hypothetical protein